MFKLGRFSLLSFTLVKVEPPFASQINPWKFETQMRKVAQVLVQIVTSSKSQDVKVETAPWRWHMRASSGNGASSTVSYISISVLIASGAVLVSAIKSTDISSAILAYATLQVQCFHTCNIISRAQAITIMSETHSSHFPRGLQKRTTHIQWERMLVEDYSKAAAFSQLRDFIHIKGYSWGEWRVPSISWGFILPKVLGPSELLKESLACCCLLLQWVLISKNHSSILETIYNSTWLTRHYNPYQVFQFTLWFQIPGPIMALDLPQMHLW